MRLGLYLAMGLILCWIWNKPEERTPRRVLAYLVAWPLFLVIFFSGFLSAVDNVRGKNGKEGDEESGNQKDTEVKKRSFTFKPEKYEREDETIARLMKELCLDPSSYTIRIEQIDYELPFYQLYLSKIITINGKSEQIIVCDRLLSSANYNDEQLIDYAKVVLKKLIFKLDKQVEEIEKINGRKA